MHQLFSLPLPTPGNIITVNNNHKMSNENNGQKIQIAKIFFIRLHIYIIVAVKNNKLNRYNIKVPKRKTKQ